MTKKQLKEWQDASIAQAYEAIENEIILQYSGYVSYGHSNEN